MSTEGEGAARTHRHDVFISHSSKNKVVADTVCAVLERRGIRCWIAPRDIMPGQEWAQAIIRGIADCRAFVLIFSTASNSSAQVRREVERAANHELPIIPFRIDDIPAHESLEFFISSPHWLDALSPPLEEHANRLADVVDSFLHPQPSDGWDPERPADAPPTLLYSAPKPQPQPAPDVAPAQPTPAPVDLPAIEPAAFEPAPSVMTAPPAPVPDPKPAAVVPPPPSPPPVQPTAPPLAAEPAPAATAPAPVQPTPTTTAPLAPPVRPKPSLLKSLAPVVLVVLVSLLDTLALTSTEFHLQGVWGEVVLGPLCVGFLLGGGRRIGLAFVPGIAMGLLDALLQGVTVMTMLDGGGGALAVFAPPLCDLAILLVFFSLLNLLVLKAPTGAFLRRAAPYIIGLVVMSAVMALLHTGMGVYVIVFLLWRGLLAALVVRMIVNTPTAD